MKLPAFWAATALAVAATASASPSLAGVNQGVGRRWNAVWHPSDNAAAASPPNDDRDLLLSAAAATARRARPAPVSAPAASAPRLPQLRLAMNDVEAPASYLDSDPASTLSMGVGGPMRIELPLDSTEAASFAAAGGVEQQIAAQKGKHVVLTHKEFPQVSVRIKQIARPTASANAVGNVVNDQEAFCDPTVTSWSGYIDTLDGKSLFFYFFESRSDPENDPVLLWVNGGPGCSSALGLFSEHGPCRVPERGGRVSDGPPINGTTWHAQSWNNRANIIYLDQPVGVGFSYSRFLNTYNTEDAAVDVYRFLRIFFSAFERFRNVEGGFHISGESYGGRYVPVFASEVADRNAEIRRKALKAGKKPDPKKLIDLRSVIIGNGLTDVSKQMAGYYDMSCTRKTGYEPILSIAKCKRMATWVPRCEKWLHDHCTATYSADLCRAAYGTCSEELEEPYMATGQNPYNILDDCKAGLEPNLCYNVMADIRAYLDREDVRKLIGAAPVEEIGKFQTCSEDVMRGFVEANDAVQDNGLNVAGLLERGIRALIYVGELDFICSWIGNKRWVEALQWSGAEDWHKAKSYLWRVNGEVAGETQSAHGRLTWATVRDAGHMVPYDQPDRALALLNRWLDGEPL
ncbi:hypothetical protein ACQY0O_002481 [Thecaphora frezii]